MPYADPEVKKRKLKEWLSKNRDKAKTARKLWASKNKDKVRKICKESQRRHSVKRSEYYVKYLEIERSLVFNHYGRKCSCCNATSNLTIDHINGGGEQHRKELKISGSGFYRWLRNNGYPEGYRTLCWNCNCGSSVNSGICPHIKIEKQPRKLKVEVIGKYGGKCECGETNIHFLVIDHVNNDGADHRRQMVGHDLSYWLKKHNYPDGFKVLCWNCNAGKYWDPRKRKYLK